MKNNLVKKAILETSDLTKKYGSFHTPHIASAIIALSLAILSILGVLAFHFPQYFTTPELRQNYSVEVMRILLFFALVISGSLNLLNITLKRNVGIHLMSATLILISLFLGGANVSIGNFTDQNLYIGLDWFILDLLGSTIIFSIIEKILPLHKNQALFRKEWQTDLIHFSVNHFIVGIVLLISSFFIHNLFGWMVSDKMQYFIQNIHFIWQLLLCILVADLAQYWTHRAYHEIPFLWRFHSIHHSVKTMDWLAGSRQHMLELIVTRVIILGCLFVMGFSQNVMNAYIIIVGFQAVFNHANVSLPWGPFKYLIVTPDFHHWHHASDDIAIDKNYAAHYSFLDYLFGTAIKKEKGFPKKYGVVGDNVPEGFINQQIFPFKKEK